MNATDLIRGVAVGLGATLAIDLWSLALRRAFGIRSLDFCLLGRWVLHMPAGRFAHESITTAAGKHGECAVGWTAHYSIGIAFALVFVWLTRGRWLAHPTLLPALAFGVVTVLVPFLVLQPALGLGVASSKAPHPNLARARSVMTHAVFGLGLWATAYLV